MECRSRVLVFLDGSLGGLIHSDLAATGRVALAKFGVRVYQIDWPCTRRSNSSNDKVMARHSPRAAQIRACFCVFRIDRVCTQGAISIVTIYC